MEKEIKSYDEFKDALQPDDFSQVADIKAWFDNGGSIIINLFTVDLNRSTSRSKLTFRDGGVKFGQDKKEHYEKLISRWLDNRVKDDPNLWKKEESDVPDFRKVNGMPNMSAIQTNEMYSLHSSNNESEPVVNIMAQAKKQYGSYAKAVRHISDDDTNFDEDEAEGVLQYYIAHMVNKGKEDRLRKELHLHAPATYFESKLFTNFEEFINEAYNK